MIVGSIPIRGNKFIYNFHILIRQGAMFSSAIKQTMSRKWTVSREWGVLTLCSLLFAIKETCLYLAFFYNKASNMLYIVAHISGRGNLVLRHSIDCYSTFVYCFRRLKSRQKCKYWLRVEWRNSFTVSHGINKERFYF